MLRPITGGAPSWRFPVLPAGRPADPPAAPAHGGVDRFETRPRNNGSDGAVGAGLFQRIPECADKVTSAVAGLANRFVDARGGGDKPPAPRFSGNRHPGLVVPDPPESSRRVFKLAKAVKGAAKNVASKSSSSWKLGPLGGTKSHAGGPTPPDVRGPERTDFDEPHSKELSGRKRQSVESKVKQSVKALYPVSHPSKTAHPLPETAVEMADAGTCRAAIGRMFDADAHRLTNDAGPLADEVMRAVPRSADRGYEQEPALTLATALGVVTDGHARAASELLAAARSAQRPTGELRVALARLHRVLASSNAGMDVLCHLEGVTDPQRKEALGDAMRISIALADKGMDPGGPSLLRDLVRAIYTPQARASWLRRPVGGDDDAPQQLLSQALLYAYGQSRGGRPANPMLKRAYVAWKKCGFTESGKGTDFNKSIERLNKFAEYGRRGDHGPRTARNLAREAAHAFPNAIGHRKDVIGQMRHGVMGGDRQTLEMEADKFRVALDQAIAPLADYLDGQLADRNVQRDVRRMTVLVARAATLEQWRDRGRKSVRVDVQDVLARADRIHMQLGRPGVARLDQRAILRELKVPAKLQKDGAPGPSPQGKGLTLYLKVLERWGADALKSATGPDRVALGQLQERVAKARSIARGREPTNPLFEWKDVGNILTGKPARQGPTLAAARRVARQAAEGKYESTTYFRHQGGGGVNVHAVIGLKAGHGAAVVPSLRLERAKAAMLSIGLSLTGGRFYLGTAKPKSAGAGLTGAFGVPLPKDAGVAAAFAEAAIGRDWSEGEGACITTRSDIPGWEAKGADVVDFMFDHAEGPPRTATEFWGDFVDRFGDDPHVAMSWVTEHSKSTTAVLGVGGTVRGNVGNGMTLGPSVSASLRNTWESFRRKVSADGGDVPVEARSRHVTANLSASVAQATPAITPSEGGVSGLLNVLPLLGYGAEKVLSGNGGVFRLGRMRDGRLSPSQCQEERQFRDRDDFIGYVNAVSARWKSAMTGVRADHMSATDLHPTNRLNKFLHQVKKLRHQGNQTFGEFKTLEPATASQIDRYEDRMKTLLGVGDPAALRRPIPEAARIECDRLQNEIRRLMTDEANWKPVALYAFEKNAKQTWVGWDWLLKLGSQGEAGATRLPALLVVDKPDLRR